MDDVSELLKAGLLIDGRWRSSGSGGEREHVNPATGRGQRRFPLAGTLEVDEAVVAARRAFRAWKATPPEERAAVLLRIAGLIRQKATELGLVTALENGTPHLQARNMAPLAARWFEYYAGWADKLEGRVIPGVHKKGLDYTTLEPVGVVAVIVTWNGPLIAFGMAVAPALAAGCSVVVKPAELTPFTPALFGRICDEAGLPPGVLAIVPGAVEAGEALVRHPGIDKISFTGGLATARRIQSAAADALTPLVLELGGKSANIVFADADVDRAAELAARFTSLAGQGCSLPTRLLVEESVYEQVIERLLEHVGRTVVGDPLDDRTTMGPVINDAACERVLGMIERARAGSSGSLLLGGARIDGPLADGYFIEPTVFGDVDPSSELGRDEVFGPVLSVLPFIDEDHAIELANGTDFGLAAYLHTRDVTRAHRVASELEAGNIAVNDSGPASAAPGYPFGGTKLSGYGRQGGYAGISEFVRTKNVFVALDQPPTA